VWAPLLALLHLGNVVFNKHAENEDRVDLGEQVRP
jgi:hypothetical protein